jgi:hypothetical protein
MCIIPRHVPTVKRTSWPSTYSAVLHSKGVRFESQSRHLTSSGFFSIGRGRSLTLLHLDMSNSEIGECRARSLPFSTYHRPSVHTPLLYPFRIPIFTAEKTRTSQQPPPRGGIKNGPLSCIIINECNFSDIALILSYTKSVNC